MASAELNELTEAIWRVETKDFGGYSHRDAMAIAKRLLELGYHKEAPGDH